MIWIIIIAVVAFVLYLSSKGDADMKNVKKYGGLKNKYRLLINNIMSRNSFYQVQEINANNVRITNTGMVFRLIEMDKKLQVVWNWESFTTGQVHKLVWNFDENENQDKMYETIDRDMKIQNFVDDGMTKQQATDWLKISYCDDKQRQEQLIDIFSKKYPDLWSKMFG